MNRTPGKYTVFVDDNYHYQDERERYRLGSFDNLDAAVAACKGIVDRWLKDTHSPEMSATELNAKYTMFGEDPFIVCEGQSGVLFSAWGYAKERCEEICKGSADLADTSEAESGRSRDAD